MSKLNFSQSKFSRFISSKGFYVAVAFCLVGAGAATWFAVDQTVDPVQKPLVVTETAQPSFPTAEETEKKSEGIIQKEVPLTPPSSAEPLEPLSSSQTSSSQSEPPSEPVIKSEQSPVLEKSPTLVYSSPINGNVIGAFSNGELVQNLTMGDWRTHDGIDIAVNRGVDVLAVADGTVKEVRTDPLWGTVIVISHADGNESIYCGLSSNIPIQIGDAVASKQAIGKVDGVPCEIQDETHIHFGVKKDGVWVDPLTVVPR